jgi:cytosine/adenosine deaminase-related metal-dependent hydrolase
MAEIQDIQVSRPTGGLSLKHVSLPHTKSNTWDVLVKNGTVEQVIPSGSIEPSSPSVDGRGALLAPSFCHPHIHIDKAYLLSHPRYSHLQIEKGDFAEAMQLTGQAKSQFEHADLLERGQRLIDESVNAGVTHMRAFVEIDAVVMEKCLSAGIDLKRHNKERCTIQICAFAQLPLFKSTVHDPSGHIIQELIRKAANDPDVDVLGSTPYVEDDLTGQASNIDLMIDLAIASGKHLVRRHTASRALCLIQPQRPIG